MESKKSEISLNKDDFEMGVTLGTGSFGRVRFATYKTAPDVPCAVKILKKAEIVRQQQVEHLFAEKDILESISRGTEGLSRHPFIVNLFSTFNDSKYLYMVFEYVNGGEFFTHLRRMGRLDNNAAKFYAGSIVAIFEHLHHENVIYRDLKPENMLLDGNGFVKLTDFGFAKKVAFKTYTLCGTPEYIAPEVLLNKGHGKGVDWWTLGIIIYEMLVGTPPFVADDPMTIYQRILGQNAKYPKHLDKHAKSLISKLLLHDLSKRYGCLKKGAQDIRTHKWFTGFKFDDLIQKKISPPIQPHVGGPTDTSNYDEYPDTDLEVPSLTGSKDPFSMFSSIITNPAAS